MAMLRLLHAHGAPSIAQAGGQTNTALHAAAVNGHDECVRFILTCSFAINTTNINGDTALHTAAEHGQQATIKVLLDSGADIEAKDEDDYTPLERAMNADQSEAVRVLVARGATVIDGFAAVAGAGHGSIAALKALLASPQWLAMRTTDRLTAEQALLYCVKDTATLSAIRSLVLDMSVLIQRVDPDDGGNALHYGAEYGKAVPLICALIKEGVNPAARNKAGQTPAEVAREAGHTLQATLLERAADDKRRRDQL